VHLYVCIFSIEEDVSNQNIFVFLGIEGTKTNSYVRLCCHIELTKTIVAVACYIGKYVENSPQASQLFVFS
jgi:ribosomal protein S12